MKDSQPNGWVLLGCAVVITMIMFVGASHLAGSRGSSAQEPGTKDEQKRFERLIPSLKGPDLFRAYCAPCHGADGKGGGPVAPALKASLPDLTTIAQRHGGVFPEKRIEAVIAGDEMIIGHGSREMPVWGPIFHQVEYDRDYGNIRMKNLVNYLKSIQQK
jgi:hypothetical protein